MSVKLSSNC